MCLKFWLWPQDTGLDLEIQGHVSTDLVEVKLLRGQEIPNKHSFTV